MAAPGSLHGPAPSCPGAAPPAAGGVLPRRLVEAAHGLPKADGGRADQGGGDFESGLGADLVFEVFFYMCLEKKGYICFTLIKIFAD